MAEKKDPFTIIEHHLKSHGKVSMPYLQCKLKMTYVEAVNILKEYIQKNEKK